jgi:hypothetical protein
MEKGKNSPNESEIENGAAHTSVTLSDEEQEPVVTPKTWVVVFVSYQLPQQCTFS